MPAAGLRLLGVTRGLLVHEVGLAHRHELDLEDQGGVGGDGPAWGAAAARPERRNYRFSRLGVLSYCT